MPLTIQTMIVKEFMFWICFLILLVIYTWAMLKLLQLVMWFPDITFKKVTTYFIQLVGIHLVCLQKMLQLNVVKIQLSGLMQILKLKQNHLSVMQFLLIGRTDFIHQILNITNGLNGSFYSYTKKVWLIEKQAMSTGVHLVKQF